MAHPKNSYRYPNSQPINEISGSYLESHSACLAELRLGPEQRLRVRRPLRPPPGIKVRGIRWAPSSLSTPEMAKYPARHRRKAIESIPETRPGRKFRTPETPLKNKMPGKQLPKRSEAVGRLRFGVEPRPPELRERKAGNERGRATESANSLQTAARQAPQSMGFSRQESWTGLLLPPSRDQI